MSVEYDENLARYIRALMDSKGIKSSRQAEMKTGVSFGSIQNMLHGKRVKVSLFVRFVKPFGVDIGEALRECGYTEMAEAVQGKDIEQTEPHSADREPEATPSETELTREEFYDDLPPELRKVVGWHAKVINAIPPGKQRDMYVASLEAQAEANWALIEQREKEEEQNR